MLDNSSDELKNETLRRSRSFRVKQEHVIAIEAVEPFHSGCLWKSMWAIMMERERGREREKGKKKRRSPEGFGGLLGSSAAANSITVHMCKHLRYLLV
ncbi:hypothetical protein F2P81_020427 [Scophthalmus maximus]|uniref:Uncharacterized protein n=1 Tax=Scophthalmus maximus TaxID=52904 RepID=A0A6A4RXW9_SCOMX|nr:hypothetical protein F2P81_020427 [Scophthalmus maximus]